MADNNSNLIPVAEAIKGILEEKLEKTAESSPTEPARTQPHLEPKSFFWDNIIIYLAYTILGLSVSNIVVDFVRPEPNTVKCYTSMNISRDIASQLQINLLHYDTVANSPGLLLRSY